MIMMMVMNTLTTTTTTGEDDEDHSLATPETDYRWDTSNGDLEHSRFALNGVKRAGPITFHRFALAVSAVLALAVEARLLAFLTSIYPRTSIYADTPPRTRVQAKCTTRYNIFREAAD
ncbi:hypothetical protein P5V15_003782 [Pogonomyrmex californicus]